MVLPALMRELSTDYGTSVLHLWMNDWLSQPIEFIVPFFSGILLAVFCTNNLVVLWGASLFVVFAVCSLIAFASNVAHCGCVPGLIVAPLASAFLGLVLAVCLVWQLLATRRVASARGTFSCLCGFAAIQLFVMVGLSLISNRFGGWMGPTRLITGSTHSIFLTPDSNGNAIAVLTFTNQSEAPVVISGFYADKPAYLMWNKESKLSPGEMALVPVLLRADSLRSRIVRVTFVGHSAGKNYFEETVTFRA